MSLISKVISRFQDLENAKKSELSAAYEKQVAWLRETISQSAPVQAAPVTDFAGIVCPPSARKRRRDAISDENAGLPPRPTASKRDSGTRNALSEVDQNASTRRSSRLAQNKSRLSVSAVLEFSDEVLQQQQETESSSSSPSVVGVAATTSKSAAKFESLQSRTGSQETQAESETAEFERLERESLEQGDPSMTRRSSRLRSTRTSTSIASQSDRGSLLPVAVVVSSSSCAEYSDAVTATARPKRAQKKKDATDTSVLDTSSVSNVEPSAHRADESSDSIGKQDASMDPESESQKTRYSLRSSNASFSSALSTTSSVTSRRTRRTRAQKAADDDFAIAVANGAVSHQDPATPADQTIPLEHSFAIAQASIVPSVSEVEISKPKTRRGKARASVSSVSSAGLSEAATVAADPKLTATDAEAAAPAPASVDASEVVVVLKKMDVNSSIASEDVPRLTRRQIALLQKQQNTVSHVIDDDVASVSSQISAKEDRVSARQSVSSELAIQTRGRKTTATTTARRKNVLDDTTDIASSDAEPLVEAESPAVVPVSAPSTVDVTLAASSQASVRDSLGSIQLDIQTKPKRGGRGKKKNVLEESIAVESAQPTEATGTSVLMVTIDEPQTEAAASVSVMESETSVQLDVQTRPRRGGRRIAKKNVLDDSVASESSEAPSKTTEEVPLPSGPDLAEVLSDSGSVSSSNSTAEKPSGRPKRGNARAKKPQHPPTSSSSSASIEEVDVAVVSDVSLLTEATATKRPSLEMTATVSAAAEVVVEAPQPKKKKKTTGTAAATEKDVISATVEISLIAEGPRDSSIVGSENEEFFDVQSEGFEMDPSVVLSPAPKRQRLSGQQAETSFFAPDVSDSPLVMHNQRAPSGARVLSAQEGVEPVVVISSCEPERQIVETKDFHGEAIEISDDSVPVVEDASFMLHKTEASFLAPPTAAAHPTPMQDFTVHSIDVLSIPDQAATQGAETVSQVLAIEQEEEEEDYSKAAFEQNASDALHVEEEANPDRDCELPEVILDHEDVGTVTQIIPATNIVSGVKSFLDEARKAQQMAATDGKKPLQVKALKLAEAAKKAEERRQKEREDKRVKLAQHLEIARLEKEKRQEDEKRKREEDKIKREMQLKEDEDKRRRAVDEKLKRAEERRQQVQQILRKKDPKDEVKAFTATSEQPSVIMDLDVSCISHNDRDKASMILNASATGNTSVLDSSIVCGPAGGMNTSAMSSSSISHPPKSTLDSIKSAISSLLQSSSSSSQNKPAAPSTLPISSNLTHNSTAAASGSSFLLSTSVPTSSTAAVSQLSTSLYAESRAGLDDFHNFGSSAATKVGVIPGFSNSFMSDFSVNNSLPSSCASSPVHSLSPLKPAKAPLRSSNTANMPPPPPTTTATTTMTYGGSTAASMPSSSISVPPNNVFSASASVVTVMPQVQAVLPSALTKATSIASLSAASTLSISASAASQLDLSKSQAAGTRFVIPEDKEHSDSEDEEDDEEETVQKKKSKDEDPRIPSWARGEILDETVKNQARSGTDPDEIFGVSEKSCDLESVFGEGKKRYKRRTSSSNWSRDHFTKLEELEYKKAMGFKGFR
eukprot:ANDGO_05813.mRNA.1 hypothetical protein